MAQVYTDSSGFINFKIPCISEDGEPLTITSATANAGTPTWFVQGTSDADGTFWPEGQESYDGKYVLYVVFKLVAADVPYGTHTIALEASDGTRTDSVSFDITHTQITPVADNNQPIDISDLETWFSVDNLIGHHDGAVVKEISDNRNNDKSLVRSRTTEKPKYIAVNPDINGKPSIRFNNSGETMYHFTSATDRTLFIVAKPTNNIGSNPRYLTYSSNGGIFSARIDTNDSGVTHFLDLEHQGYVTLDYSATIPSVDQYRIYTVHFGKDTHMSIWVDGVLLAVFYSDTNGGSSISDFQIGKDLYGDIAEVVTYSRDLVEGEHQYVLSYLSDKYNIPVGSSPVLSSPVVIDDCASWYHAGAVVDTAGVVSELTDMSGNGNHLVPPSVSNSPTVVDNQIDDYPVIRFDGVDDYLQVVHPSTFVGTQATIFIVCSFDDVAGYKAVFDGVTSSDRKGLLRDQSGNDYSIIYGASTEGRSATHGTEYVMITLTYWDGLSLMFLGQDLIEGYNATGNVSMTGLTLGAQFDGSALMNGDIAEFIHYDRILGSKEQYEVERYLEEKYFNPSASILPAAASLAPTTVANLLGWWDASNVYLSNTTSSGGNLLIDRVDDSSINEHALRLFNNDTASRPTKSIGYAGQPEIDFTQNGSAQLTVQFGSDQGDEFTIFMVARVLSDELSTFDAGYFIDGDTENERTAFWYGREGRATVGMDHGASEAVAVGCLLDGEHKTGADKGSYSNQLIRLNFKPTGSDDEFYLNNQLLIADDLGGESISGIVVGGPYQGLDADNDNMLSFQVAEMIIYTGTVSGGDTTTIENYLIDKHYLTPYVPAPLSVDDLEVWYDAEYLSASDVDGSNFITAWKARSGTGYEMTSVGGASANQPTLSTGGASSNFQNYAEFTATSAQNGQITFPADIGNTTTIFMVANVNSDASGAPAGTFFDGVTTGNRMRLSYGLTSEAEITLDHGGTPAVLGSTNMADGVKLIRCEFNGTGVNDEVYIDQVQVIDSDTGDDTLTGLTLGNVFDPTSGTNDQTPWTTALDGNIWTCLVYSRALTTQEKSDIEDYLKERYNI